MEIIRKLGEIASISIGITPSTKKQEFWNTQENGIPFIDGSLKYQKYISKEALYLRKAKICKKESILLSILGNIDLIYTNDEFSFNQQIANIEPNEKIIKSKFLFYLLKNNLKKLKKMCIGTVAKHLNKNILSNFEINISLSLIEQQEIIDIIEPFEKMLNHVNSKIDYYKKLAKYIFKFISTDENEKFLLNNKIISKGYNNQKYYIDTSCVGNSLVNKWETISKRKSRANLTVQNKSIILSKMKGNHKIFPIFDDYFLNFIFSTGFLNIESKYSLYVYGWMQTDEFLSLKNSTSQGTLMEGINNRVLSNWEIPKINLTLWNDNFNNILILICKLNLMKLKLASILNNLINLFIK